MKNKFVHINIFCIFVLSITIYNAKSENTYLKNSPARGCTFPSVHSVVIGDRSSSSGLSYFIMKSQKSSLAITHPQIASQWHPTKNDSLTPFDVTFGSNKKIWWKCEIADDHEWDATVNNRYNGRGCPFCSNYISVLSNCMATTHPEIAAQWHPTKNYPLTPFDVVTGSHKKVWWKCDVAEDHEWEATIYTIKNSNGNGCPCCNGKKVVLSNCIATTHPDLVNEWHPIKNLPFTPFDVTAGSGKKIWWKCDVSPDHEWIAPVCNKTMGMLCPCCGNGGRRTKVVLSNCLATTHSEISKQWHPTKNLPLTPFNVLSSSEKMVWWKCDVADDHEWEATINSRIILYMDGIKGCPCCSGRKVVLSNCLKTTNPDLSEQWHPTKNLPLTPMDVTFGVSKKVWWKCPVNDDHEWTASPNSRTGAGCPCCYGRKAVMSNCLSTTHPGIAKQWHPTKNISLTPFDVVAWSHKKIWWKCSADENHEWRAAIYSRTCGSGCPYCYESRGEKEIKKILNKMNINYDIEKTFNDCKNIRKLSFDFYLPKYNALIEYDGKQHFEPIKYFGGIKYFKLNRKIDKIKNEFATKNNIPLLRIPYTKFDSIEDEIMAFISNIIYVNLT